MSKKKNLSICNITNKGCINKLYIHIYAGIIMQWLRWDEGVQNNRIFMNVTFKSCGRPPASSFNELRNSTSLCQGSCATCTQRLASNMWAKIMAEAVDEPGMQWNCSIHFEPKLWVEREKHILRFDILVHDECGIGGTWYSLHDYFISLKGGVGFVCWKPEGVSDFMEFEGEAHGDLFVVTQSNLVWPCQFTKAKQSCEAHI